LVRAGAVQVVLVQLLQPKDEVLVAVAVAVPHILLFQLMS
jgi:hypothetical protein